jgi:23S rRNA pseudouridine1911/1915/1917 synthase
MREIVVDPIDAGMRLDQWLAARTDAGSRRRASEWLERGKIYVNGGAAEASAGARRVAAGDRIGLWIDRPGSARAVNRAVRDLRAALRVVYEDAAIVVVDKPAGVIVEPLPGRAGEAPTLVDLLADRDRHAPRARVYVVHRIDRDTSGLVLFARTPVARDVLKAQFEAQRPERRYDAVVLGRPAPASGVWRDALAWDPQALRQRRAHGRDARAKDAEARYRVVEQFAEAALIEVSLVTGKRNQIRVQAAMRGHPVLGERQYRFDAPAEPPTLPRIARQALHAASLSFLHPSTGDRVAFTAPWPADFASLVAALRRQHTPSTA